MAEDNDIREVMADETGRGRRRPHSAAAARKRARLLRALRPLFAEMSEGRFRDAMRTYGLREDSPEFEIALQIWRESQKP